MDSDFAFAMQRLGFSTQTLRHTEGDLKGCEAVVLPFSMSFGGYYRPGALAAQTPLARAIESFARRGGPVLGISDGFAVLTELKLLPGALLPNMHTRFHSMQLKCRVVDNRPLFFQKPSPGEVFNLHVASANANYTLPCDAAPDAAHVVLRFAEGNGFSNSGIAAMANASGNVVGMLPIPERNWEADGGRLLASMFSWLS
jgi:phosphoribosylformylglycinamidine synthase